MTAFQGRVAWSIPVDVEVLGAHLEAYVRTRQTLDALRTCHRYGHGEHVAVNRLPLELIVHIEGFIVRPERARLRRQWSQSLLCYQAACSPTDHLDEKVCRKLYSKYANYCDPRYCRVAKCPKQHLVHRFPTAPYKEFLDEALMQAWDTTSDYRTWSEECLRRSDDWRQKFGQDVHEPKALFAHQADLMLRDFGLCALAWRTNGIERAHYRQVDRSTLAFLALPGNEFHCFPHGIDDRSGFFCEGEMELPGPLSSADIVTFKRAFQILGLPKVVSWAPAGPVFDAPRYWPGDVHIHDLAVCAAATKVDLGMPKLRLLVGGEIGKDIGHEARLH